MLAVLEADSSLGNPRDLEGRADLRDTLESELAGPALPADLRWRAEALLARAEALDVALAGDLRARIVAGTYTPAGLRAELGRYSAQPGRAGRDADEQYDSLDLLISRVLDITAPAGPLGELPAGMVAYQPTPARWLLDLSERAALTAEDTFVDIGAGLGQPTILMALLSEVRAIGIEREPAYVTVARHCAHALGLSRVSFRSEDALATDLGAGTIFYLYTPFTGAPLRQMLDRLHQEAAARSIRVCAYGPCLPVVAAEGWLKELARCGPLCLFRSVRP